ncbi:IS1182 family transposase [bacterium]|nr:IS1182 family transposase [bacterium]
MKNNGLANEINRFVEECVPIERFSAKAENEESGAEAIHPRLILKIIFYSYASGVTTSRAMEKRLMEDVVYQVLAANETMDHSTICNFMNRYRSEIIKVFEDLGYLLWKMGYIDLEFVAVDGTKIEANTSRERAASVQEYRLLESELTHRIEDWLKKAEQYSLMEGEKKNLERITKKRQKIHQVLEEIKSHKIDAEETTRIHLSDPDARLMKDKDRTYIGYNAQAAVDGKNDFIVGHNIFQQAADNPLFQPMIESVKQNSGKDLKETEIAADAGYFSSENLAYAQRQDLNIYLPEGQAEGGKKEIITEGITSRDCHLEIQDSIRRLTCPGNQIMETTKVTHHGKGKMYYVFSPDRNKCDPCSLREKCYGNIKRKIFKVKKEYFDALLLRKAMAQKLSSADGKARMLERASTIEHVFGFIKDALSFRRFFHRGLDKVRLVWSILCTAYNLRRLAVLNS